MTSPEQFAPATPPAASHGAFDAAIPTLRVRDLPASVAHYVQALGFTLDWQDPDGMASVSRGRCRLFLCEDDQGTPGSWVWIGVPDAEALHDELHARGATIRQPPTNFAWALELQVEDPDGNVLRLGSAPKPGVAHGPWLDMDGRRWMPTGDGAWTPLDAPDRENRENAADAADAPAAEPDTAETPAVDGAATPADDTVERVRALKLDGERARRAGDLAGARRLYEKALALERTAGDPLELAHTIRHLGDVLHDARQPQAAEALYQEALALYRAHPAPPPLNLANALRAMAVLKQETGDSDASRRLWEEASRLYQQANVREGVAESAGWAARLAWRAGDLSRARDWLAAARAASDASDDRDTWKFVREVGLELGG